VAESIGQDVRVPWFSGLCLEGEVAGQYEIERPGSQQEVQETTKAGVLELDGLAPITIFVGANNSGKSRLMRELFKIHAPAKIKQYIKSFNGNEIDIGATIVEWLSSISSIRDIPCESGWIVESDREEIGAYLAQLENIIKHTEKKGAWGEAGDLRVLQSNLFSLGIEQPLSSIQSVRRCYLPMLRGMRPPLKTETSDLINGSGNDWYQKRTEHDYFSAPEDKAERVGFGSRKVFTGLGLYGDLRRRLLAKTQAIRDSVRKYEQFLSSHFFAGQEVILIPVEEGNNDVVHIKIGNKERPIYDLGDGMQSLIICTYPIVTETEPGSLFFLEEPDLCMHPSLQRTFLEVLKTYHRKMGHQFFITTHSNHLLDLLEDNELVSIFSFSEIADRAPAPTDSSQVDSGSNPQQSKPKPSFRIRPSNLTDRQTLVELGVRPSATYLANATIWVEGVSDCAYLRAYMEAFVHYLKIRGNDWGKNGINGKNLAQRLEGYKEDRHYAFVEYSGSNLEHYSFIDKNEDDGQAEVKSNEVTSVTNLCATALVIADGDVHDKGDRKIWFEDQLKERFICLPCKEIENLIPELLMKQQIIYDHTKPKQGDVPRDTINSIDYASYARSKNGIGAYLCSEDKNISKYQARLGEGRDSGTLPPRYKTRWRSETEGIPALLRKAINPESSANKPEQNDITENPVNLGVSIEEAHVPDCLTHDLIWLCVCIYSHVAKCNHDTESEEALNGFQQFIRDQGKESQGSPGGPNGDSLSCAESDDPSVCTTPEWPIKNVCSRNCLLKAFLLRSNNSESTPSLSSEPNAASTSSAHGATAYPASLTP
jgi:hypothetical protein